MFAINIIFILLWCLVRGLHAYKHWYIVIFGKGSACIQTLLHVGIFGKGSSQLQIQLLKLWVVMLGKGSRMCVLPYMIVYGIRYKYCSESFGVVRDVW